MTSLTLLERWDEFTGGNMPFLYTMPTEEIRRAIAIAQAVEEDYSRDYKEIMRRADELLGGSK